MAKPITIPNTFASATSAIPLSQLDQDFSTLANATNDLATYSNYVADTGAADAYIANFPANTNTSSLTAGLTIQFKAANANTGASTLNVQVNGSTIGTAAIRYANGSALAAGAIAAGAMVSVMYDGTNFQLINDPAGQSGGDVTGPASATDNAIARFDGASGKLIQNSVVTIADTTGDMSGIGTLSAGNVTVSGTANAATLIVTGVGTFAAGTVSAPAITTTGDTNTGIFFPAADTIAFSEGGVEAMRINSSANVGIGTITANSPLTVAAPSGTAIAMDVIGRSADNYGIIRFVNNAYNAGLAQIIYNGTDLALTNNTNNPIVFATNNTERMRIASGGNVGIGTTSPSYKLQVTNATGVDTEVAVSNSAGLARYGTRGGGNAFAGSFTAGTGFEFWSAGSQRMTIDSSGNVGIGTSSPTAPLSVSISNTTSSPTITIANTDLTSAGVVRANFLSGDDGTVGRTRAVIESASDGANNGRLSFYTRNAGANTERMRIDSSGNVLIGTTTNGFAGRNFVVQQTGVSSVAILTGDYSSGATSMVTTIEALGGRNDGNGTFGGRHGAAFRRSDGTAIGSGANIGVYAFGGQWGTDTSYQSSKVLYPASIVGVAEGSFTASNAMPTAIVFRTGSTGEGINTVNTSYGTERMRIDSSGGVGIGTSSISFQTKLAVASASTITDARGILSVNSTNAAAANLGGSISFGGENGQATSPYVFGSVAGRYEGSGYAGYLQLSTTNSGGTVTERMRITSAGDVGIGTGSPASKLGIAWSTNTGINLSDGTVTGVIYNTGGNSMGLGTTTVHPMVFYTSNTERMRITSGGELLVGQTAVDGKVVSNSGSAAQRSYHGGNLDANCNTDGVYYAFVNRARTTAFNFFAGQNTSGIDIIIYGNGNIENRNGSYGTISDVKNKENIVDATPKLEKINQLKVRNFNFKGDDLKQIGFVAQEFEQVFPSMVEETPDRDEEGNDLGTTTKSIKTSVLIPILVKAMQEQQAMIEELKARIETLEAK